MSIRIQESIDRSRLNLEYKIEILDVGDSYTFAKQYEHRLGMGGYYAQNCSIPHFPKRYCLALVPEA